MKAKQIDMKVNKTDMQPQDINNLLRLFMEGQTSEAEERTLKQYFLTHKDVPAEWEPYRVLFHSFETGIYDYAPTAHHHAPTAHRHKWAWRRVAIWSASIAAAIVIAFFLIGRPRTIVPAQPQIASISENNNQPNLPNQPNQPNRPNQPNQPNRPNPTNQANRPNPTNQPNHADQINQPIPPAPTDTLPQPVNPVTITAHQAQPVAVIREDDLPITNPEALRLTHDDRAQMARLDAQRYIELLRIDLENQKYEIAHPSEIEHIVII